MVFRFLIRASLPTLLGRTVPGALILLFAFSQLSAMVDFVAVAQGLRALPWWQRALGRMGLVLLGASTLPPVLWAVWEEAGPWMRSLPLSARALAGVWVGLGAIGALPVALIAGLEGLGAIGAVAMGSALLAFAAMARRPGLGLGLLLTAGIGLWGWGAVAVYLLWIPMTGRAIRSLQPPSGRARSRWMGSGPISALWSRDWALLLRHEGRAVLWTALSSTGVAVFVLFNMSAHWEVRQVDLAALCLMAVWGWVPAWVLSRLAEHEHPSLWDRTLPVHPMLRALVLAGVSITPLIPAAGVALAWVSGLGWLRVVGGMGFLGSWAVWRSAVAAERSRRVQGTGGGVALGIFSTLLGAALGPSSVVGFGVGIAGCLWLAGRAR